MPFGFKKRDWFWLATVLTMALVIAILSSIVVFQEFELEQKKGVRTILCPQESEDDYAGGSDKGDSRVGVARAARGVNKA